MFEHPEIVSVDTVLQLKNLNLPNYQRPYKWSVKNVSALMEDLEFAIDQTNKYPDFKYRVGTIILHNDETNGALNIVDGQQRIITLALICKALDASGSVPILETKLSSKVSEENIRRNFLAIRSYFAEKSSIEKKRFIEAVSSDLEFVVVATKSLPEAFQLFDSQNTRGRALDPHDLLKAFHLREMRDHPNEMKHTVDKWERTDPKEIHILFQYYLFPIKHWIEKDKGHRFTSADIDEFKGVSFDLQYYYAMRTVKGMPVFQIDQTFVSGKNFFEYVEHYLNLLSDVKAAVSKAELDLFLSGTGVGFSYAKQLFYCVVLYYCDRFRNFDDRVIKRLYAWAFMVRLQMQKLGFDTVRNYAIGEKVGDKETIPMFYLLQKCMKESDVLRIMIPMLSSEEIRYSPSSDDKILLLSKVQRIMGLSGGVE
ncbi:hypothetical protein BRE01_17110 [Brevibacillus reuszeri]|uniref:Uncharacterized protein n=1 Tax=Brevibacillus reuszeri TaxID=54915 RepID=A0A0K9Z0B1_9BACL|nr:DUF262 domain-containing protein [Brevibacillus reuszeri]KNB74389.1 hypothetical protein ADS79_01435 [Brevibacillus reuszeri]MED1856298.1 DUF262 domain-containing protein [Brevibacillus reuszeri]GED68009.1 hypothetical protein BRE01_17110 [Brevibacillus reuszeri]